MTANPLATLPVEARLSSFREDVLRGLALTRKELPSKYFYDAAGARLFERICELDEYYPTRTELAIMERHAAEMAELLGPQCLLIEYGSGSSLKTRLLLDHLVEPAAYVPVDISVEHLRDTAAGLARDFPHIEILPLAADFTHALDLPETEAARRVVYFPGSTIGNFTHEEAVALLRRTSRLCGADGGLLLGADLKKDPGLLHAAYNDCLGVTADFNLNLLKRINRELDGDFQLQQFWHHAFYDPTHGRIEMHLVGRRPQRVRVAERNFWFEEGESIRTEYSHKYSPADVERLGREGGVRLVKSWFDVRRHFGVFYFRVAH